MATITGTSKDEDLYGGAEDDLIRGKGGDDLLAGWELGGSPFPGDGRDTLNGGGGRDDIGGGYDNDLLEGGGGRDRLDGGQGRDRLYADRGDDSLYGGEGNDRLYGGEGADTMRGGDGRDRFVFEAVADIDDRITDFTLGRDWVKFVGDALGSAGTLTFIGTGEFSAAGQGEIRYDRFETLSAVYVDVEGTGAVDIRIILDGSLDLTADDFIIG